MNLAQSQPICDIGNTGDVIIEKSLIDLILFHRGRMSLLDKVTITSKEIMGTLFVRHEICQGHEVPGQGPVMKGSDCFDMAAQLLGVGLAYIPTYQHLQGRQTFARKYGGAKCSKFVIPGETVSIVLAREQIHVENMGNIFVVIGKKFVIKNDSQIKATVSSVQIDIIT